MNRFSIPRQICRASVLSLLLLGGFAFPASGQRDFSKVEVENLPVAGAVSMLTGMGGNIGVSAGEDGILIVDDQFEELSERIAAALDGLDAGATRLVLNTHFHFDHPGGNAEFGRTATIIAQENVRKRLAAGSSVQGLVSSINKLIETLPEDTVLIPGHGPVSTMADLTRYRDMLLETIESVRRHMGAARPLEKIVEAGLPDTWESWGTGFISEERWIATIHRAYSPANLRSGR
jgi:glyoxylase-like metal-dependent hydrolase (beta-lactamase superfamily II)